jgi:predicted amidophosphoribosyltransferase
MYCSSCGAAVAKGLSYCNRCGAKLSGAKGDDASKASGELFPDSLVWAIVSVFIVGFGLTMGLMTMMKNLLDFSQGVIIAFTALSFLLTIAVESMLIWLLLSRRRSVKDMSDAAERLEEQTTKELDAAQARALPEPTPSVTEHTTRTFEPIYSERKSK